MWNVKDYERCIATALNKMWDNFGKRCNFNE